MAKLLNGPRAAALFACLLLPACTNSLFSPLRAGSGWRNSAGKPAGDPAGDSIAVDAGANLGVVRVTDTSPILGARSMQLAGPGTLARPRVQMYSAPLVNNGKSIPVRFTGQIAPDTHARINVFSGGLIASVELRDNVVLLYKGMNDWDPIGVYILASMCSTLLFSHNLTNIDFG